MSAQPPLTRRHIDSTLAELRLINDTVRASLAAKG